MTLAESLADLYRRFGYASTPAAAVTTRLTSFLNETQREIVSHDGMSRLTRGGITFASVTGQAEYGLPPSISRILAIRDTANRLALVEESEAWYRRTLAAPTTQTGLPRQYALLGLTPVQTQPTNAGPVDATLKQLYAVSDNAGDVQKLYFEVIQTTGVTLTGELTLAGLTNVTFGASYVNVIQITDAYLASAAVGTVTIFEMVGGVGVARGIIAPGQTRTRYPQIALMATPAQVLTYTVDYEFDVTDLVKPTDEWVLPVKFHWVVGAGARAKEYEQQDDAPRWALAKASYEQGVGELRAFLGSPPGLTYIPGRSTMGWSPLGAYYPTDRGYGGY